MTSEAQYRRQQEEAKKRHALAMDIIHKMQEDHEAEQQALREALKAQIVQMLAEEKNASVRAYLSALDRQLDPEFDAFEAEIGEKSAPEYAAPTRAADVEKAIQATPLWKDYMEKNKGETVRHTNPVKSDGKVVCTSGFGKRAQPVPGASTFHKAVDMAVEGGGKPDVAASADGVVLFAGWKRGWGWTVEVGHADGSKTRYSHLDNKDFSVSVGQEVKEGQTLGRMGNTGLAGMGVHLDYAQYGADGKPVAPVVDGKQLKKGDRLEPCEDDVGTQSTGIPLPNKPRAAEVRM